MALGHRTEHEKIDCNFEKNRSVFLTPDKIWLFVSKCWKIVCLRIYELRLECAKSFTFK